MPKIEKWEKKIAWIVSSVLGVIIVATAFITLQGSPLFDEYLLLAVVVTVFLRRCSITLIIVGRDP